MKRKILFWPMALILILASMLIASLPTSSSAIDSSPPQAPNVPSCVYTGPLGMRWLLNAPMPTARYSFAAFTPSGQSVFYAIGGLQSWTDAITANERFNACSNTWQALAPLPAPRGYAQAAELNGRIYIVGGVDHVVSGTFGVQSSVWVYDPKIDYWSEADDLPRALGGVAVAAAHGKLYAFGGFDSRGPGAGDVNTVYEYVPGSDRWSWRSSLPGGARSLAAAAEWNGEIYIVGGVSGSLYGLGRNEVYDPGARTWRTAHPIGDGFYGFSLFKAPDGYIYALGGSHADNDSWYAASRYDPGADGWTSIPGQPQIADSYNHGLSSGAYAAGRLFLVGGVGMKYGLPAYDTIFNNVNESMHLLDSLCESSIQSTPDSVAPGEYITYTIELRGEVNPLLNVIVLDPIPGGAMFDGFSGDPSGAYYNAGEDQVEWHGPLEANPAPITITFRVVVNNSGWTNGQFMTNIATIHNGLNAIERSARTWIDAFDLSPSTKRVDLRELATADRIWYTLRVQTTSPLSSTATMIDPIPLNTDYIPGSLTSTLGTASYADGKMMWNGQLIPRTAVYTNTRGDYQWGDSRGNGPVPGVKYDWIEIAGTGARYQFTEPDNAGCYHTAFPFDFTYYTSVYTKAAISTNGTLYFPPYYYGVIYAMSPDNTPIPANNSYQGYSFGRYIAPFWDDLYMTPGKIYYQVLGAAPNRVVVFEFGAVTRHDGSTRPGDTGSFEMIVFEGSSAILMQYKDVNFGNPLADNGASATVGLQNSPSEGTQYSYNTPSISDRLAILFVPPNRSITYTANFADITFAVTPHELLPDLTPITNTATISSSFGQVITRETVTPYGAPDFAASYKTVNHSVVQPNDEILYEIHVVNTGPVDGLLQLFDVAPNGLYYLTGSFNYPFGLGDETDGVLEWTGSIPAMSSATLSFRADVNGDATHGQSLVNTATLTDVVSGLVYHSSAASTVSKPADLFVASIGPGVIDQLQTMTYTLTYGNHGPFDAADPAFMVDALPPEVAYVSSSPDGVYSSTARTVTWNTGALTLGLTHTLTLTVLVPESFAPLGVLTNTVSVNAIAQDMNAANNTQPWFTRAGHAPNLLNDTAKSIDPAIASRGDVVTYTILIRNTGNVTAATTITDPIPSGASYQSGSGSVNGAPFELYDAATNEIKWTGSITPDDDVVIRFRAFLTTYVVVTNTATIEDGTGLIIDRSVAMLPRRAVFLPVVTK